VSLPAAVLWDLDGTLIDSEPYWMAAEHALVGEHGGSWSDAHGRALIGNDLMWSAEYIRRESGIDVPPAEIVRRLVDDVPARVRADVPWRPGALALLGRMRAGGLPCALVTMSYRRLAAAVVEALPPSTFAAVVTGDEVSRGKPHPEPYLRAARLLGVEASACLAIEDSPTGIASAEAAGARVLAVQHLVPLVPGPRRQVVTSLAGLGLRDVAEL
jgi:HAD superfamily hydrolase (TIGR01509 family)